MDAPAPAPWREPGIVPAKPPDEAAGVIVAGRAQPCAPELLAERVAADERGGLHWGWSPSSGRVAPVAELPEAGPGLLERDRRLLLRARRDGWLQIVIFSAIGAFGAIAGLPTLFFIAFALLGVERVAVSTRSLRLIARDEARYRAESADGTRFGHWMSGIRTPVAQAIAASILLAAIAQAMAIDQAVELAGLLPERVRAGEAWRLLSHGLLHAHPLHLAFNLLSFYALARLIEALAGRLAPLVVFVASVAVGGIVSVLSPPDGPTVGASGGVFGLVGFLLTWTRATRIAPPGLRAALIRGIAVMALVGLLFWSHIDNAAHAGGLVCGLVLGACAPRTTLERRAWTVAAWLCGAAWAVVGAWVIALLVNA